MKMDGKNFYVIAYDITDNKRRNKVHDVLEGFGKWTQFSLFEVWVTKKQMLTLQQRLARHLNADEDSVRFYPICAMCVSRVETVGSAKPKEDKVFVV
jgi:CRISPR-associated protein Cas2